MIAAVIASLIAAPSVQAGKWKRLDRDIEPAIRYASTHWHVSESWLLACSASEGGHGRFVVNSAGSQGWFQFLSGTFAWMSAEAWKAGYRLGPHRTPPYRFRRIDSPLGQAWTAAWAFRHGYSYHWYGHGLLMVPAQQLVATRLCAVEACTEDAETGYPLCAHHRRHPERRAHTREELQRMFANGDEAETAPVATIALCKADGCTNAATGKASYTGLCDSHKAEESSRRSRLAYANRAKTDASPAASAVAAEQPVLVCLAWDVERCRQSLEAAELALRQALDG